MIFFLVADWLLALAWILISIFLLKREQIRNLH